MNKLDLLANKIADVLEERIRKIIREEIGSTDSAEVASASQKPKDPKRIQEGLRSYFLGGGNAMPPVGDPSDTKPTSLYGSMLREIDADSLDY